MGRFTGLTVVAIAACSLAFAGSASGATITVDTANDTSSGSTCALRDAIASANNDAQSPGSQCQPGSGADTIAFAPSVTGQITLGTALPPVNSSVTLQGPGSTQLNIHRSDAGGTPAFRVLEIDSGTVSITGLKFSNGSTSGLGGGIGIEFLATASLDDVRVNNNATSGIGGGGIAATGALSIDNSSITNNTASASAASASLGGGGILSNTALSIDHTTISNNDVTATSTGTSAVADGGGILLGGSAAQTIDRSTIAGNTVAANGGTSFTRAEGAGIYGGSFNLTVRRSTVNGNTATATGNSGQNSALGGGIDVGSGGTYVVDRVTISANSVSSTAPNPFSLGGGLYAVFGGNSAHATITSSTITANSATIPGAGSVANAEGGTFRNTIISDPQPSGMAGTKSCIAALSTSAGYNIDSETSCAFTQPSDHQSTDPMFAPGGLVDNGGPTKTFQLLGASPAVDQGISAAGEVTDQRERSRPSDFGSIANAAGGDGTDIGAFERQDVTPPDTSIASGPDEGSTITSRTPSFEFTVTEPGSTFECDFDGAGFGACPTPFTAPSLADGPHTLSVRATDPAHNTDQTPATRSFSVDATGPVVTLTAGPAAGSVSSRNVATFEFTSDDPAATLECAADGGAFGACSSAASDTIGPLGDGVHTFQVRGTDQLGNVGAAAARSFTVDTRPPETTIAKKPKKHTHSAHARFTFSSDEQGVTFQCSVGNAPFKPCQSPVVLKHLKHGSHRFRVEAIDAAGNVDGSPAHDRWRIKR
jgi:hypothetical protein